MNILILSCGSRVKLVQYFKNELEKIGGFLYTTDCSNYAPALYCSDEHFIVPKITDKYYIQTILSICKKNNIDGVLSLIDPELSLLAEHRDKFEAQGTNVIVSDSKQVDICLDKMKMYEFLIENNIPTVKTFTKLDDILLNLENEKISFPLFAKPKCGSASLNMMLIHNKFELESLLSESIDMYIVQEYIQGKEYGIDVYVDLINNNVVSLFSKEKLKMRAGETDKSVSVKIKEIEELVKKTIVKLGLKGPLDVDVFEHNGKYLISEINPRFGGGYLHAHEAGYNHVGYIITNMSNKELQSKNKKIEKTVLLKYSETSFLKVSDISEKKHLDN